MQKKFSLKTPLFVIASCLSLVCMARTFTWTGAGGDNNWSNQANWLKDGATADRLPQSGDSVVLTNTTAGASGNTINVDVDTETFNTLTFKGTQSYTLTSTSGKTIFTSGSWYVGAETSNATLTVSLTCVLGGKLYIGCDENLPGVLNVTTGANITATRVQVGGKAWDANDRHGWVYQSGGTVTVSDNDAEAFKLGFAGGGSTGYYELTGGTLAIPVFGSVMSGSTGTFLLNGGTIKATAAREKFCEAFNGTRIHLQIGANGGTFDTDGHNVNFNDYAIETGVSEGTDGGLNKAGQGVLTLGARWQFTGELTVEEGTVVDSDGKLYGEAIPVAVHERRVLTVNDVKRSYALYVPKEVTLKTEKSALVFSLHGAHGRIYRFYKDVGGVKSEVDEENAEDEGVYCEPDGRSPFKIATADEAGCIVVYPQGLKRNLLGMQIPGWLSDGESTEDIDFFKAIIEDVAANYQVDRKRIYCCGFSNGGMMTYAATTLASDTFAAFASISGYQLNEFHLRATGARPVPFLHIHGKSDDFVKYSLWPTIRDMMVARNGCVSVPTVTTVEGRYTKSVYAAGEGGFPYVAYECDGMGHTDGTDHTEDGDSSKTMWNFMSQYTLDDACDKTLKMRMDSTTAERGWTETAAGTGAILSYGTNKQSGDSNVYRSIQLEKGTYTLSLKSNGIVNNRYFAKLVDVTDETHILLNRSAKIGQDANLAFAVDAYCQCKLVIARENAADSVTEIAIHSGAPKALSGPVEYTALEFIEIPQTGMGDGMTKEEGDGYTGYTASGDIQVAYKMQNVDAKDCEYVLVKFAEPVPESGWRLSFTGDVIELPLGATEYTFVINDSIRASGTLPECTLFTWFGGHSQQIKVTGVYKARVKAVTKPLDMIEIPQTGTVDGMAREEGDGYTGYTASGSIQVAYKMQNVDVEGCDFVVVKFAEPVPDSGWWLSFTGGTIDLPKNATEYNFIFPESVRTSGILPECTLLTGWGTPSHQIKVEGVYKVPALTEVDEVPSTFAEKGHLMRIAKATTFITEKSPQTVWERQNISVAGCDYILVKFGEPVGAGWGMALEGIDGYVRIPEGAIGYRIDLDESVVESGLFPKLALVALGPDMPQTLRLDGIYKHSLVKGFAIHLC